MDILWPRWVVNRKRAREVPSRGRKQTSTLTPPHTRTPPSRLGAVGKRREDGPGEQPDGGGTNTYGRRKVAASRCPAPRDSPALSRQEGDD